MKHNPNGHGDDMERNRENIDMSIHNTKMADDMIEKTDSLKTKEQPQKTVKRSIKTLEDDQG